LQGVLGSVTYCSPKPQNPFNYLLLIKASSLIATFII